MKTADVYHAYAVECPYCGELMVLKEDEVEFDYEPGDQDATIVACSKCSLAFVACGASCGQL